ncbi:MAG: AAA family ATPase [Alkaliphilus sp.]
MNKLNNPTRKVDNYNTENQIATQLVRKKMKETLVARSSEIKSIKKQFDRVLEGNSGLCIIKGLPGIGKTSLIQHVIKDFATSSLTYVCGKFRHHDKRPFIAISEIIEQMTKHLLTIPTEQLESKKKRLFNALSADAGIIISICPYAAKLLGQHKTISIDDNEKLKYRVKRAIYLFISTISESLFPLVIFIDDLQWADTLSLETIELLCRDHKTLNLLLILAYRDIGKKTSEEADFLFKIKQSESTNIVLHLQELTDVDIQEYMQLVFASNISRLDYVVRIIHGLTVGNPFYIKEIINTFVQEKVLIYSQDLKQWKTKIDSINKLTLPASIEQLLMGKIYSLTENEQLLIDLIACFDGNVEYCTLREVIGTEEAQLDHQLQNLRKQGFLIETTENWQENESLKYRFVHDIILETVYNKIKPEKKARIHYRITKHFINHSDESFIKKNRLFIASHLLRSDYRMMLEENTENWIHELFNAGIEVRQTATIEQAQKIFELCEKLLSVSNFKKRYDLELKNQLELGECDFISERYEESAKRFVELLAKYNAVEDLISIKRKYMNLYAHRGDSQKSVALGIEILHHLDFKLSINQLKIDILRGKLLFTKGKIAGLKNAPPLKGKRITQILEVLTTMIPTASCIDDKLFQLILMKIAMLSVKYGNSPYAPIGYGAYSFILNKVWKNHELGKELTDLTLELAAKIDNPSIKAVVYSFVGTFVSHWSFSLKETTKQLENSIEEGIKIGEFLYSGCAIISVIHTKYVMGTPLKEIADYSEYQVEELQRRGYEIPKIESYYFNHHIHYLEKGLHLQKHDKLNEDGTPLDVARDLACNALKLQRLYFAGEKDKAYKLAKNIAPSLGLLEIHIMYLDLLFYCMLSRLANHNNLQKTQRKENKKAVKKYLSILKYWTNLYKDNHYARYLLAKAEHERVFQKESQPEKLYSEAVDFAHKQDQVQLEALGNLLLARNCKNNKKLSGFYATEAILLYKKWGAAFVASSVEKEFKLVSDIKLLSKEKEIHLNNETITQTAVADEINKSILHQLNQMENMDEEEAFISFLDFIAEKSHVNYAAVLIEKSDEMYLKYEKECDKLAVWRELINLKHINYISRKLIRYVERTGEEVILNKKPNDGIFANDLYIMDKEEISIVCMPMMYLGVFVGIIYLERDCKDGFSDNIIRMIKILIPSLISKITTIKEVNLHSILNPQKAVSPLTDRELEVLQLVAEGMSNSVIGKKLHITLGTTKNHLSNIYSKLEVDSRIKAVVKAKEINIVKM